MIKKGNQKGERLPLNGSFINRGLGSFGSLFLFRWFDFLYVFISSFDSSSRIPLGYYFFLMSVWAIAAAFKERCCSTFRSAAPIMEIFLTCWRPLFSSSSVDVEVVDDSDEAWRSKTLPPAMEWCWGVLSP